MTNVLIARATIPYDALWAPRREPRREQWLMFLDDHGQCADRDTGRPFVATVMVPVADEDRMRALVAPLRAAHGEVKARSLTEVQRNEVADTLRTRRWLMSYFGLEPASGRLADARAIHELMAREFRDARTRLRDAARFTRRLDLVERQLLEIADGRTKGASYVSTVWMNLRHVARWFRGDGVVPQLRAWFDERLASNALARFLLRLAFFTAYPEVYSDDLATMLGTSRRNSQHFTCRLGSDGAGSQRRHVDRMVDGLVLADIVAYFSGVWQRGISKDRGVDASEFAIARDFMDRAHSRISLPFDREPWRDATR